MMPRELGRVGRSGPWTEGRVAEGQTESSRRLDETSSGGRVIPFLLAKCAPGLRASQPVGHGMVSIFPTALPGTCHQLNLASFPLSLEPCREAEMEP